MNRALLDTSFVVALGNGEHLALEDPPPEAAISAVTLCGLHHGRLVADGARRSARITMLAWAERQFDVLPLDAPVAPFYARLAAAHRQRGYGRLPIADGLIAATALAHRLPVITCDRGFQQFEGVDVVLV
jgi:predicted nucleic acid-binding protein